VFNRDGIFGKKEDSVRRDVKQPVNVTPALGNPSLGRHPPESARSDAPSPDVAKPTARTDDAKGSKLIVGPDIKLKGVEITDCDTLVVEGRVEAAMDSRVIQIAEKGVFSGTVGIDVAEIHGRFEGELTARKQLVIHSGGKVSGKIRYGKITVEEGGEISGDISTLAAAPAAKSVEKHADSNPADIMTAYDPFARKGAPRSSGPLLTS
jgi:cytoskeletal protein CcmA (bactofilin family)